MSRAFASILAVALATPFATAQVQLQSSQYDVLPLEQVASETFLAPDMATIEAEDVERDAAGLPYRFAVPNAVAMSPATHGTWENLDEETLLWRLRIEAPGAQTINVGFDGYEMPEGGELWMYASDLSTIVRAFTAEDNESHGQLWTPPVASTEVVFELVLPVVSADELDLRMTHVGYGYRGFDAMKNKGDGSPPAESGSCNVDVVCPEGDEWRDEIPSVGALILQGFYTCSGVLVNNVRQDNTPYYLTAQHCGIGSGNQASVVVIWNYENTFCRTPGSPQSGQNGNGSISEFNSGSILRASYGPSDFTLVELDDPLDPAHNLGLSGWDATGATGTSAVAIHHPQVQEKRISFEDQGTRTTSYFGNASPGNGTHVKVTDWDLGTTEGGSSGSPLYDQDHHITGQLHGGLASCSSQTADWYGKFSVSFTGGGSPSSSLQPWLDPDNTGTLVLDTRLASDPLVVSYCTAGTSASGCKATLSASGTASATANSGFVASAADVEGNKDGQYYFGTSGQQGVPWGTGTSFRCVVPPTSRGGLLSGVGTSGACDGTFSQDLNTHWVVTNPSKNPGAGATVQLSFWYRDPSNTSNQTTSFSDALEFTLAP
jgi:hypothetical protein